MADQKIRGIHDHEIRDPKVYLRDSRRLGERFYDFIATPPNTVFLLFLMGVFSWVFPWMVFITLPLGWLFFLICHLARKSHWSQLMPLRAPRAYGRVDYNDPKPGRSGFFPASGIMLIGNDIVDHAEVWASKRDLLAHILVLGTTGAGKSENLLSKAANILAMGGGLIYADAKGTVTLQWQLRSLARAMGIEDDYLCINYLTGNKSSFNTTDFRRQTNTASPFALCSADSGTQILTSLAPQSQGDNAIFSERAIAMVSAVMYPLTELRDQGKLTLGPSVIREYLNFDKVVELSKRQDVSERARDIVLQYLKSLPGYDPHLAPHEQPEEVGRQFGFAQAYFTRALSSLADTYGHIYWTTKGEVDYQDVVMNNRILGVTLPALEKAPPELQNLGKINLAALKDAMSIGLGATLEGDRRQVIESLPIASDVPTLIILDEYGYQSVEGFAVTAAQARGLGFSIVFAGQDWAGFKRGSETEAGQIWGNTRIKEFMALEDYESMEMASKAVGEALVTQVSGFEKPVDDTLGLAYRDSHNAGVNNRARIDIRDLQEQIEGEMHLVTRGRVIRARAFHANVPLMSHFRLNRFLKLPYDDHIGAENIADMDPFERLRTSRCDGGGGGAGQRPAISESEADRLRRQLTELSEEVAPASRFKPLEDSAQLANLTDEDIELIAGSRDQDVENVLEQSLVYEPPPVGGDTNLDDLVRDAIDRLDPSS